MSSGSATTERGFILGGFFFRIGLFVLILSLTVSQTAAGDITFDGCIKEPKACADICKQNPGQCARAWWESQDKRYLLIASSATSTFTPLEYVATQDLPHMKQLLTNVGFKPVPGTTDLAGANATTDNVADALRAIPSLTGPNHLVVVYFTGHGLKSSPPGVLSLKLAGTGQLDVTELITDARHDDATGRSFTGTLIVIVDSCDSGQALLAPPMAPTDADRTWIFASSSSSQNSHEYTPPGGQPQSVFTYLLTNGIENDWNAIDINHSGFIQLDELAAYIYNKIEQLGPPIADQDPHLQPGGGMSYLLFDPSKSSNPSANVSQIYGRKLLDELSPLIQGDGVLRGGATSFAITDAEAAAAGLIQDDADAPAVYRVAKAIAEKRFLAAQALTKAVPDKPLADLLRARTELYAGDPKLALTWYNQARNDLEHFGSALANSPSLIAETGVAYLVQGDTDDAVKYLRYADSKTSVSSYGFSVKNWLAFAYVKENNVPEALGVYSQLADSGDPEIKAMALANTAELQRANLQVKDATKSYKQSVNTFDHAGIENEWLKTTLQGYSKALQDLGRDDEAAKVRARIQSLEEENREIMKKLLAYALFAGLISVTISGCNVDQMVNQYFANLGLNRLATPRTDLAPGAIIVSTSKVNSYYGNINKFIANPSDRFDPKNVDQDALAQFQAVLPQYTGSSAVDGSLVLKVVDEILPVNLSSALKLNGQVSVSQVQADGLRLDPSDLEALINDPVKGAIIRQWLQNQWDNPGDGDIYIAYETYSARDLKITEAGNSDISGDLTLNQTKTIGNGEIKVDITKTSNTSLDISGASSYVFAVKTGKIEPRGGGWRFKITATTPGIVKGAPEVHAIPITEGPLQLTNASGQ